jgi:hypothetical protein
VSQIPRICIGHRTDIECHRFSFGSSIPQFGNKQAKPVEGTFAGFRYLASDSFWQLQAIKVAGSSDQILTRINGSHGK